MKTLYLDTAVQHLLKLYSLLASRVPGASWGTCYDWQLFIGPSPGGCLLKRHEYLYFNRTIVRVLKCTYLCIFLVVMLIIPSDQKNMPGSKSVVEISFQPNNAKILIVVKQYLGKEWKNTNWKKSLKLNVCKVCACMCTM